VATVAGKVPVVTGETGDSAAGPETYLPAFLPWAASHGLSVVAWTWNAWNNPDDVLVTSMTNGSPTAGEGVTYKNWLAAQPVPSPAPTSGSYKPGPVPAPAPVKSKPPAKSTARAGATANPTAAPKTAGSGPQDPVKSRTDPRSATLTLSASDVLGLHAIYFGFAIIGLAAAIWGAAHVGAAMARNAHSSIRYAR
jgi:hypothetical protein